MAASDIFARQEQARRATRRWLLVFALTTAVLAACAGLGGEALYAYLRWTRPSLPAALAVRVVIFVLTAVIVVLLVLWSALRRLGELREGGQAQARAIGARAADSASLLEARLIHVVEEMAIATGLPPPAVAVLADEHGINACVLGWRDDHVLCVTMGALRRLERAQLQALVAHEMTHIQNHDVLLRARITGWVHGLQSLAHTGVRLMFPVRNRAAPLTSLPLIALGGALAVTGAAGYGAGELILAAVARQRERLADAGATQLCRDPSSLAQVLAIIGGFPLGARIVTAKCTPFRHLFIAPATTEDGGMLATHPALAARIRALDPAWDGHYRRSVLTPLAYAEAARVAKSPS